MNNIFDFPEADLRSLSVELGWQFGFRCWKSFVTHTLTCKSIQWLGVLFKQVNIAVTDSHQQPLMYVLLRIHTKAYDK